MSIDSKPWSLNWAELTESPAHLRWTGLDNKEGKFFDHAMEKSFIKCNFPLFWVFKSNIILRLFIHPSIAQRVQQLRKKLIHSRNKTKFEENLVL
jgi:hypothetical protein